MTDEPDMIDDDIAMEEWMDMTEAQQDAALNREMDKYNRWYDHLTLKQKIRVDTRSAMRSIKENRRRLQTPELCTIEYVVGLWRDGLRRGQLRLVKIRAWRATGIYPGEG
jgi:hypothetical protein